MPWSPLESPRLAGPQPTRPASPAPSHGNHSKALAQAPPPLPPDWPWGVPCGPHGIPCPLLWELPAKTIFPTAVVSWCPGPAVPHSFPEHTTLRTHPRTHPSPCVHRGKPHSHAHPQNRSPGHRSADSPQCGPSRLLQPSHLPLRVAEGGDFGGVGSAAWHGPPLLPEVLPGPRGTSSPSPSPSSPSAGPLRRCPAPHRRRRWGESGRRSASVAEGPQAWRHTGRLKGKFVSNGRVNSRTDSQFHATLHLRIQI